MFHLFYLCNDNVYCKVCRQFIYVPQLLDTCIDTIAHLDAFRSRFRTSMWEISPSLYFTNSSNIFSVELSFMIRL